MVSPPSPILKMSVLVEIIKIHDCMMQPCFELNTGIVRCSLNHLTRISRKSSFGGESGLRTLCSKGCWNDPDMRH